MTSLNSAIIINIPGDDERKKINYKPTYIYIVINFERKNIATNGKRNHGTELSISLFTERFFLNF
jgi:hypothetical protein